MIKFHHHCLLYSLLHIRILSHDFILQCITLSDCVTKLHKHMFFKLNFADTCSV